MAYFYVPVPPPESHDGKGGGDHDHPFTFGNPRAQLTIRQQARLVIMRGYILDYLSEGARGGAADGDLDWITMTETGVFVPIPDPVT